MTGKMLMTVMRVMRMRDSFRGSWVKRNPPRTPPPPRRPENRPGTALVELVPRQMAQSRATSSLERAEFELGW